MAAYAFYRLTLSSLTLLTIGASMVDHVTYATAYAPFEDTSNTAALAIDGKSFGGDLNTSFKSTSYVDNYLRIDLGGSLSISTIFIHGPARLWIDIHIGNSLVSD